jgi:hypothetical protein
MAVVIHKGSVVRTLQDGQYQAVRRVLAREGEKFSIKGDKMYIRTRSAMNIVLAF